MPAGLNSGRIIVITMLGLGSLGYALEYPHLKAEYIKNPPAWSKYAKNKEDSS
eukprot:m.293017 g.293017  ORF g.293017 m.293017 type:complete len:53 (+) comp18016_c0_seq1:65-223(+)